MYRSEYKSKHCRGSGHHCLYLIESDNNMTIIHVTSKVHYNMADVKGYSLSLFILLKLYVCIYVYRYSTYVCMCCIDISKMSEIVDILLGNY